MNFGLRKQPVEFLVSNLERLTLTIEAFLILLLFTNSSLNTHPLIQFREENRQKMVFRKKSSAYTSQENSLVVH